MQRARPQPNYSIAGLNWTHIRLSHSLTHKHFIEKLCQQNTDIENCLDIAMHQKTKFLAKTENSGHTGPKIEGKIIKLDVCLEQVSKFDKVITSILPLGECTTIISRFSIKIIG